MKVLKETTVWKSNVPNHTYALASSGKLVGYVNALTGEVVHLKTPLSFDKKYRTFKEIPNTFGFKEPTKKKEGKVEETRTVTGSKGDVYTITKTEDGERCSCPGFIFRGKCKHIA